MQVELPIIDMTNLCVDNSCDLKHCAICHCHMIPSNILICDRCQELTDEEQGEVRNAVLRIYDSLYMSEVADQIDDFWDKVAKGEI